MPSVGHTGGTRPKPLESRLVNGTPSTIRKAKKEALEVAPRVKGEPKMPSWFDAETKTIWQHYAFLLQQRGQFSIEIESGLAGLASTYAEFVKLNKYLQANGRFHMVQTAYGEVWKTRPEQISLQDCDRRFRGWLIEFGLTDASRSKVVVGPKAAAGESEMLSRYGLN